MIEYMMFWLAKGLAELIGTVIFIGACLGIGLLLHLFLQHKG